MKIYRTKFRPMEGIGTGPLHSKKKPWLRIGICNTAFLYSHSTIPGGVLPGPPRRCIDRQFLRPKTGRPRPACSLRFWLSKTTSSSGRKAAAAAFESPPAPPPPPRGIKRRLLMWPPRGPSTKPTCLGPGPRRLCTPRWPPPPMLPRSSCSLWPWKTCLSNDKEYKLNMRKRRRKKIGRYRIKIFFAKLFISLNNYQHF